jgi:hypothetical protein
MSEALRCARWVRRPARRLRSRPSLLGEDSHLQKGPLLYLKQVWPAVVLEKALLTSVESFLKSSPEFLKPLEVVQIQCMFPFISDLATEHSRLPGGAPLLFRGTLANSHVSLRWFSKFQSLAWVAAYRVRSAGLESATFSVRSPFLKQ